MIKNSRFINKIKNDNKLFILLATLFIFIGFTSNSPKTYATEENKMKFNYEVLIIGGGPAGLSSAMSLGRISRSALVCDDNNPRNAASSHINNFPSQDGIHPETWRNLAKKDLEKYETIKFFNGRVNSVKAIKNGFQAKLSSGSEVTVKKIILAYGIKDKIPPIPGFKELWGKSIFHCPFCHGFEIRGSKLGFIISNENAFHMLPMIINISSDLVIFTNDKVNLSKDQKEYLKKNNVRLVEDKIASFQHDEQILKGVVLVNGNDIAIQYLFYNSEMPFELKSDIGETLGCKKNQIGLYETNEMGATSVPGVFAAGDNISMAQSVLFACASGSKAAMATIRELLE